ncbi:unnamed protein product [Parajaminaea phylloscopi]
MASNADSNAAAKAAGVVKGQLDNDPNGAKDYISKAVGENNASKIEDASGFVGTSGAKDAVEESKQSS